MIEVIEAKELCKERRNIFDEVKNIYNDNKDKFTNEESEFVEFLDSEILSAAIIGYGSIERVIKFKEHLLLYASRIASHYEKQGFIVSLHKLHFDELKILIKWCE